jgi:drug/metabolite transporter (DMT)-like permease
LTIFTAGLAEINAGVITVIWNLTPLFLAICDYFFLDQRLTGMQIYGMFLMMTCTILIGVSGINNTPTNEISQI